MNKLQNYCRNTVVTVMAIMATVALVPSSNAALVHYSQDFEALHPADPAAFKNQGLDAPWPTSGLYI